MCSTEIICGWLREIERQKFPSPIWIPEKQVFEYEEVTVEIVAFLKAVRATQSLHSLQLLAANGLTFDFGTVVRAIHECTEDVHFLLEDNPRNRRHVKKYVDYFRSTTIENARQPTRQPVKRSKIHNSAARSFTAFATPRGTQFGEFEERLRNLSRDLYRGWCNVAHSNYGSIMEIYGPRGPNAEFQLAGIPSEERRSGMIEYAQQMNSQVASTIWLMTMRFNLQALAGQIREYIIEMPDREG